MKGSGTDHAFAISNKPIGDRVVWKLQVLTQLWVGCVHVSSVSLLAFAAAVLLWRPFHALMLADICQWFSCGIILVDDQDRKIKDRSYNEKSCYMFASSNQVYKDGARATNIAWGTFEENDEALFCLDCRSVSTRRGFLLLDGLHRWMQVAASERGAAMLIARLPGVSVALLFAPHLVPRHCTCTMSTWLSCSRFRSRALTT